MNLFRNWKPFELIWLCSFSLLAIVLSVLGKDSMLGLISFLSGVISVVLTAKGNIWTFWWGYVNILTYAYIAWTNHLYGESGLYILFYFPATIIGLILWSKNTCSDGDVAMRTLSRTQIAIWTAISIVSILLVGFGLSAIKDQETPYLNAMTVTLSVIATLLMNARFREQWACWLILDIVTVILWSIRWIHGSPEGPIMVTMWTAYVINATYGWYNWTVGSKKNPSHRK